MHRIHTFISPIQYHLNLVIRIISIQRVMDVLKQEEMDKFEERMRKFGLLIRPVTQNGYGSGNTLPNATGQTPLPGGVGANGTPAVGMTPSQTRSTIQKPGEKPLAVGSGAPNPFAPSPGPGSLAAVAGGAVSAAARSGTTAQPHNAAGGAGADRAGQTPLPASGGATPVPGSLGNGTLVMAGGGGKDRGVNGRALALPVNIDAKASKMFFNSLGGVRGYTLRSLQVQ